MSVFVKTYQTVYFWPVHFILCKLYLNKKKKSEKLKNRSGGSHVSTKTVTDSSCGCEENACGLNILTVAKDDTA